MYFLVVGAGAGPNFALEPMAPASAPTSLRLPASAHRGR